MKNGDERSEVAPTLGRILHVLDTVTGMRVDDFLSERFKGIPRGDDLIENVSAVRVFRNQSLKSLDLAADFPQPEDERILFSLRVDVFHGYYLSWSRVDCQRKIAVDCQGGRGYRLPKAVRATVAGQR